MLSALALGFFLSGIIREFVSETWVEKHLGERRDQADPLPSIVGTALPVCCVGALPKTADNVI